MEFTFDKHMFYGGMVGCCLGRQKLFTLSLPAPTRWSGRGVGGQSVLTQYANDLTCASASKTMGLTVDDLVRYPSPIISDV